MQVGGGRERLVAVQAGNVEHGGDFFFGIAASAGEDHAERGGNARWRDDEVAFGFAEAGIEVEREFVGSPGELFLDLGRGEGFGNDDRVVGRAVGAAGEDGDDEERLIGVRMIFPREKKGGLLSYIVRASLCFAMVSKPSFAIGRSLVDGALCRFRLQNTGTRRVLFCR